MIVYVFNQPFPDNSGFGRRCQREIEALSTKEFVTVVCRHQLGEPMEEEVSLAGHLVKLVRFSAKSEVVHRPENYTGNGLYEIKRNLDLLANLCKTLARVLKHYPRKEVKLYCVTSPLTVPLIVLFFAYFFRVKPSLVSFHDLEPELAMHLKNLPSNHWIVKVELFLESFVCKFFNKILVTTDSQAERLSTRTHQPLSKFCSIVNTTDVAKNELFIPDQFTSFVAKNDFVITYLSTISFDYTIIGLVKFLENFAHELRKLPAVKVVIIGDGEGLKHVRSAVSRLDISSQVICLGHISFPGGCLATSDAAIIPWEQDIMTEVMLPTKLFEYLSFGIPVIAPDFGEFRRSLENKNTALLFNDFAQISGMIHTLISEKYQAKKIGLAGKQLYLSMYQPAILNKKLLNFCMAQ